MENDALNNSIVVPIGETAFSEILKTKTYFFPRGRKFNKEIEFIFFYRVKPIQAITHYGLIGGKIRDADNMISLIQKMKTFKDPSKPASAYKLSKLEELNTRIHFDSKGTSIQGRIKGNFNKIIKLKTTKGLFK